MKIIKPTENLSVNWNLLPDCNQEVIINEPKGLILQEIRRFLTVENQYK